MWKANTKTRDTSPGASQSFQLALFPLIDSITPGVHVLYVRYPVLIELNCFAPICLLPSFFYWLWRGPGLEASNQPTQSTGAMSHHDPFLLQEMSHSESELDMQLSPGSGAVAVSSSALSLLSGQACSNSGPLKTLKPLQIRLLPTMTWVCREAP